MVKKYTNSFGTFFSLTIDDLKTLVFFVKVFDKWILFFFLLHL